MITLMVAQEQLEPLVAVLRKFTRHEYTNLTIALDEGGALVVQTSEKSALIYPSGDVEFTESFL